MRIFEENREDWLDRGEGSCLLRQQSATAVVTQTLKHFNNDRYVLDAFVIMPNHVHVIFKPIGNNSVADILHSWKSFASNSINRQLQREGNVWMAENFDTVVRDFSHLEACREYISRNPTKAGLRDGEFVLELPRTLIQDDGRAGSPAAESGWKPDLQALRRAKKLGFPIGRSRI